MSLRIQAMLLRIVQERRVRPVGDTSEISVDIKIICASHRKLIDAVQDRSFREDLYFRLSVLPIHVPALRSRPEDIIPIAKYFITRGCTQSRTSMKRLTS